MNQVPSAIPKPAPVAPPVVSKPAPPASAPRSLGEGGAAPKVEVKPPFAKLESDLSAPKVETTKPKGAGEIEDIFSDVNLGSMEKSGAIKGLGMEPAGQKSLLKPALIGLGAVVILTVAGFLVWFLLIRPEPSLAPAVPFAPAPSTEEMVVEQPPVVEVAEEPVVETPPVTEPPEGTQVPLPESITPSVPVVVQPVAASDMDNDGLTDAEEVIFGTNANVTDSDGDGYSDLTEIQSGYDPSAPGARLVDSTHFRKQVLGEVWETLLPTTWLVRLDEVFSNIYKIDTGALAFISVKFSAKPAEMIFADWLTANEPMIVPASLDNFTAKSGYAAAQTSDHLTTFLTTDTSVITLSYVSNGAAALDFPLIYDFLVQNLNLAK
jgi:hypothetical protein